MSEEEIKFRLKARRRYVASTIFSFGARNQSQDSLKSSQSSSGNPDREMDPKKVKTVSLSGPPPPPPYHSHGWSPQV